MGFGSGLLGSLALLALSHLLVLTLDHHLVLGTLAYTTSCLEISHLLVLAL